MPKAGDAVAELKRRSIDIFIHDAPYILWMVSENEADLAALWEPFNQEALAWGIRKDDVALLNQVNAALKSGGGTGPGSGPPQMAAGEIPGYCLNKVTSIPSGSPLGTGNSMNMPPG